MSDRFATSALELPRVLELFARFLTGPFARARVQGIAPASTRDEMARLLAEAREAALWFEGGGRLAIAAVEDLGEFLGALVQGSARPDARKLAELMRALRSAERLRRQLTALVERPALEALGHSFPELAVLVDRLEQCLDEKGQVSDRASPKLAELRAEKKRAERAIHQALERLLANDALRKSLQSPQVSWRNGRPTLQVKPELRRRVPGILHDRSQSGQTVFVEPQALVEPVNALVALGADENAEVQRILAELLRELCTRASEIVAAFDALFRADFTQARARLVGDLGFVVPELAPSGTFVLAGARHPILLGELWTGAREPAELDVVPLELELGGHTHILVITGPNTGGKTVALKTLGLCALMAQCGLPVPATDGTALPWCDGIFADIGDEQAIEQSLSTFSSHVKRVASLCEQATGQSLVVLDELGAGTDPEEGGALGYAILEHLHERRVPSVVSTHLGRLKDFAYEHAHAVNGAMAFDPDELRPLFRLEIGISGASRALLIAERVGLSSEIVARARAVLGTRDLRVEELIERIERTRVAAEEHRRSAEETRRSVEGEQRALGEKSAEVERRDAWMQEEADHYVDEQLRDAREVLLAALAGLSGAPRPFDERARALQKLVEGILGRSSLGRRRERYLAEVRKGHMVFLPRFGRRFRVQRVDKKRRRLVLDSGSGRLEAAFDEVSWLQPLDRPG